MTSHVEARGLLYTLAGVDESHISKRPWLPKNRADTITDLQKGPLWDCLATELSPNRLIVFFTIVIVLVCGPFFLFELRVVFLILIMDAWN